MNVEEIVHDMARRYQGTYVLVQMPGKEEKHVFFCDRVDPDADQGAVLQLSSDEFGKIALNLSTGHTLLFEYPPIKTFQFGKDALYFRRLPQRQFRRGLCPDNGVFLNVARQITAVSRTEMSFELVDASFKAESFTMAEALKMIKTGKYRSVALSDGFSLVAPMTANSKKYGVFFFDLPVADISDTGEIEMLNPAFTKEVQNIR